MSDKSFLLQNSKLGPGYGSTRGMILKQEVVEAVWATESPDENARTLLPPLEYLAQEARRANLAEIAEILESAVEDVNRWINRTVH